MRTFIYRLLFSFSFLKIPTLILGKVIQLKVNKQRMLIKMVDLHDYEDENGIINLSGGKISYTPKPKSSYSRRALKKLRRLTKRQKKWDKSRYKLLKDEDGFLSVPESEGGEDCIAGTTSNCSQEYYDFDGESYTIDRFTGKVVEVCDYRSMHKITENLATGAIGCDIDAGWVVVTVYNLDDNETSEDKVREKIVQVSDLLKAGFKVCVCCRAGINRSNTIAISALVNTDPSDLRVSKLWNKYHNLCKHKVKYTYVFPNIVYAAKAVLRELRNEGEYVIEAKANLQPIPHASYLKEFYSLRTHARIAREKHRKHKTRRVR